MCLSSCSKATAVLFELSAIVGRRRIVGEGEVLNLLGIWRGASFADVIQATGFGEPGKGAPHGNQTTCFAAYS
jgi:hypothetical protein